MFCCYRWAETKSGQWTGVLFDHILTLMQTDDELLYKVYGSSSDSTPSKTSKSKRHSSPSKTSKRDGSGTKRRKAASENEDDVSNKAVSESTEMGTVLLSLESFDEGQLLNGAANSSLEVCDESFDNILKDYFNLNINLTELYEQWSAKGK